ncbi:uncharacterized protein N7482_003823 [Penicillium canariense]|uniref:Uncharacterized protein n=1 Tax=Penicillium canariense TaxID=189055 RepID=A0A9W9I7Q6_9EURO|nr:uncharacterized protein N7482_003823 [Penicillium canariense]KAJ5168229.1 hypothetical protein N7482_003823 [Penicillium canariense]
MWISPACGGHTQLQRLIHASNLYIPLLPYGPAAATPLPAMRELEFIGPCPAYSSAFLSQAPPPTGCDGFRQMGKSLVPRDPSEQVTQVGIGITMPDDDILFRVIPLLARAAHIFEERSSHQRTTAHVERGEGMKGSGRVHFHGCTAKDAGLQAKPGSTVWMMRISPCLAGSHPAGV